MSDLLQWPLRNFNDGRLLKLGDFRSMRLQKLQKTARSMARAVYLGNDTALCRVLGRYKFFVDANDLGFASHIMLDGYWEIALTQFIARHVKPGMRVIDVGANFGYYSVLMSELVSKNGHCTSIEPNPSAADRLEASIAINGFARRNTVLRYAVGDGSQKRTRFFVPRNEPKNGRVISVSDPIDASAGHTLSVDCAAMDTICADMDRVDFIKIDAEGAEPKIFRGMQSLLDRYEPDIIMEFNYQRYSNPAGFLAEIVSRYPVLRYLDIDARLKPVSAERLARENLGQDWLLFLSTQKNVRSR